MDISWVFRWNKARLIRGLVSLFHTYWFCPPTISISLASRCLHGRWSPIIDWICQSEGYGYHQLGGKRSFWHVWWLSKVLYKHQSSQSKRGLRSQVFTLDVCCIVYLEMNAGDGQLTDSNLCSSLRYFWKWGKSFCIRGYKATPTTWSVLHHFFSFPLTVGRNFFQ